MNKRKKKRSEKMQEKDAKRCRKKMRKSAVKVCYIFVLKKYCPLLTLFLLVVS